jgi:hypothetical protein
MKTNKPTVTVTVLAGAAVTALVIGWASVAHATTWGSFTCSFDDPSAIGAIVGQARATFVVWSLNGSTTCTPNQAGCHFYVQSPLVAPSLTPDFPAIHVEPTVYPEAHLFFEEPRIAKPECFTANPPDHLGSGFGRLVNGTCPIVNWANEPRAYSAHAADETTKVWLEGRHWSYSFFGGAHVTSTGKRIFDLTSVDNKGSGAVILHIHAADDGQWYDLTLSPGVNDVSWFAYYIDEAQFTSVGKATTVLLDDLVTQNIRL